MKDPRFQPCAGWAKKLAATHLDDLSPTQWAELEAHIAHCPACAAVRAEYRLMDEVIRNYPADQTSLHPPPPIPTFASRRDEPPLPALDNVYRKLLPSRSPWQAPFAPTPL